MRPCSGAHTGTRCRPTRTRTVSASGSWPSEDPDAILQFHHCTMTPAEYERARALLGRRDPILGAAIQRIGPCGLASRQRADHLTALVGAVVSQQLSTKAAA